MAKIWLTVSGGWDRTIDDVPRPEVVKDLEREIDGVMEVFEQALGGCDENFSDNLPPELKATITRLMDDAIHKGSPHAYNDARRLLREFILSEGAYEFIHNWDIHEGSFYGIYLIEV